MHGRARVVSRSRFGPVLPPCSAAMGAAIPVVVDTPSAGGAAGPVATVPPPTEASTDGATDPVAAVGLHGVGAIIGMRPAHEQSNHATCLSKRCYGYACVCVLSALTTVDYC